MIDLYIIVFARKSGILFQKRRSIKIKYLIKNESDYENIKNYEAKRNYMIHVKNINVICKKIIVLFTYPSFFEYMITKTLSNLR